MNESSDDANGQFARRANEALVLIERRLDQADIDVEWIGDGILEIEFADGSKMVINRHGVAREIWVAARSGGFHFRWNETGWIDTRSGEALYPAVARLASDQAGKPILIEF